MHLCRLLRLGFSRDNGVFCVLYVKIHMIDGKKLDGRYEENLEFLEILYI